MDIGNIKQIEKATQFGTKDIRKIGIVIIFMFLSSLIATIFSDGSNNILLIVSVVVGMYMAMNIGANDVANNVGPAVGSNTMSMFAAIIIAMIFEAGGAIIAGGDVVDTIRSGIVSQEAFSDINIFISVMLSALIAGALWLNLATFVGAPVSTTHSIVGGLIGSSIAAGGFSVIDWNVMLGIVASWVISPIAGGIIAAFFLMIIKRTITYKQDKQLSAKRVVPILIFIMSWSFMLYLFQKGLSKVITLNLFTQVIVSFLISVIIFIITKPLINKKANYLKNTKDSIGELFTFPLIFAAALLSFAHGANDVANAIGPLAAINQAISGVMEAKSSVPIWIMVLGGFGISIGLALYGPKLIRTVGSEITELDKIRAFCIALSASITVLVASALGLPVSSTHIAIGAIFGIGFLREYLKSNYKQMEQEIIQAHKGRDAQIVEKFLNNFRKASIAKKQLILKELKNNKSPNLKINKKDRKALKKNIKNELVRRSAIIKIIMAWLVTVPVSAIVSAVLFFVIIHFKDMF
ncbi:inorganic phosphate transporter [Helicobacter sp. MIT 14-3879]|uniref:inorganic phosphate transporter n=1 Tax=Helicobacter sp. MIT 14-3879 TaxID=2040649 RepID=UPI000E1E4168|nr:inorganic phosphate transporter [Helicobacter sp. MIT 14-3879]RDU63474.1 inorganic phosphate transporter [Helicobacter sp. MIT 14-3879]